MNPLAFLQYLPGPIRRRLTPTRIVSGLRQVQHRLYDLDAQLDDIVHRVATPAAGFPPRSGTTVAVAQNLQFLYDLPGQVQLITTEWPHTDRVTIIDMNGNILGHLTASDDGSGLLISTPTASGDGIGFMAAASSALFLGRFCDCAHDGSPWTPKDRLRYASKQKLPWAETCPTPTPKVP